MPGPLGFPGDMSVANVVGSVKGFFVPCALFWARGPSVFPIAGARSAYAAISLAFPPATLCLAGSAVSSPVFNGSPVFNLEISSYPPLIVTLFPNFSDFTGIKAAHIGTMFFRREENQISDFEAGLVSHCRLRSTQYQSPSGESLPLCPEKECGRHFGLLARGRP